MADEDVFETGTGYYFYFMIAPDDGYEFDEEAGFPTSYLSGERDLIDDNWSDYYENGEGITTFGFGTVDLTVEDAPAFVYGDVNGDGEVTGKDLIRLRKYLSTTDPSVLGPQS